MKQAVLKRVDSIDWSKHSHPCMQDQGKIPEVFRDLVYGDEEIVFRAASNLWDITAHQGCVGSSSAELIPLLCEIYPLLSDKAQVEVLDTLYQYASSLSNGGEWVDQLEQALLDHRPLFERERSSSNEDISSFCEMILDTLNGEA